MLNAMLRGVRDRVGHGGRSLGDRTWTGYSLPEKPERMGKRPWRPGEAKAYLCCCCDRGKIT